MKISIKDNFFEDPDRLRKIGLSLNGYRFRFDIKSPLSWRGCRSLPLKGFHLRNMYLDENDTNFLEKCSEKIYEFVCNEFDLKNYKYPKNSGNLCGVPIDHPVITSYFHILPDQAQNSIPEFHVNKFHTDDLPFAGVVYLSPNPSEKAGTDILDTGNKKIVSIKNRYNRIVCYDGYSLHGPSNTFGSDLNSGRMTFTFFIHEETYTGHLP